MAGQGWKHREPTIAKLAREIDAAMAERVASGGGKVTFNDVAGHCGDPLNERADQSCDWEPFAADPNASLLEVLAEHRSLAVDVLLATHCPDRATWAAPSTLLAEQALELRLLPALS